MKKAVAAMRTNKHDDDTENDSDCGMNTAATKTMATTTNQLVAAILIRHEFINGDDDHDDGELRRIYFDDGNEEFRISIIAVPLLIINTFIILHVVLTLLHLLISLILSINFTYFT